MHSLIESFLQAMKVFLVVKVFGKRFNQLTIIIVWKR